MVGRPRSYRGPQTAATDAAALCGLHAVVELGHSAPYPLPQLGTDLTRHVSTRLAPIRMPIAGRRPVRGGGRPDAICRPACQLRAVAGAAGLGRHPGRQLPALQIGRAAEARALSVRVGTEVPSACAVLTAGRSGPRDRRRRRGLDAAALRFGCRRPLAAAQGASRVCRGRLRQSRRAQGAARAPRRRLVGAGGHRAGSRPGASRRRGDARHHVVAVRRGASRLPSRPPAVAGEVREFRRMDRLQIADCTKFDGSDGRSGSP